MTTHFEVGDRVLVTPREGEAYAATVSKIGGFAGGEVLVTLQSPDGIHVASPDQIAKPIGEDEPPTDRDLMEFFTGLDRGGQEDVEVEAWAMVHDDADEWGGVRSSYELQEKDILAVLWLRWEQGQIGWKLGADGAVTGSLEAREVIA